jgi:hypothetical protein
LENVLRSPTVHRCVHQSPEQWSDERVQCPDRTVVDGMRVYRFARLSLASVAELIQRDLG